MPSYGTQSHFDSSINTRAGKLNSLDDWKRSFSSSANFRLYWDEKSSLWHKCEWPSIFVAARFFSSCSFRRLRSVILADSLSRCSTNGIPYLMPVNNWRRTTQREKRSRRRLIMQCVQIVIIVMRRRGGAHRRRAQREVEGHVNIMRSSWNFFSHSDSPLSGMNKSMEIELCERSLKW